MPKTATVEPAAEGTAFTAPVGPDGDDVAYVVKSSCGENRGQWYCITHSESFRNNLEKDGHIYQGEHVLAWVCFDHGPEVP